MAIGAKDREGRERLPRHVARPAAVSERVTDLLGRGARQHAPGAWVDGAKRRARWETPFARRVDTRTPPCRLAVLAGEAARMTSLDNEVNPDLTTAAEFRRLGL